MIINSADREYIETFEKKFKNFCERAPVYISYSIVYDEVHIKDISNGERFTFALNESVSVQDLITEIRNTLKMKSYPRLIEETVIKIDPSVSDLLEATKNNVSFDHAFAELSRKVQKTEYVIDKINLKRNQLVVENIESGEQFLYHLKMPVIMFLKKKVRSQENPVEAFHSLQQDGELLYKIKRKYEEERLGN